MSTHVVTGQFTGLASAGVVSITGLKVGDTVIAVLDASAGSVLTSGFAPAVVSDDELIQLGGGLSGIATLVAILERPVVIKL